MSATTLTDRAVIRLSGVDVRGFLNGLVTQDVTALPIWAGLLTPDVLRLAAVFALPAVGGVLVGVSLFNRVDAVKFRRVVFGLLFVSGVALVLRG